MDPQLWGPAMWQVLYGCSFELENQQMIGLILTLEHILPCTHCKKSISAYLRTLPPTLGIDNSKHSSARFIWAIKDRVNRKLGTKTMLPFSAHCARHEVFPQPVSSMTIVDLLCCISVQIEKQEEVEAYMAFVDSMDALVRAYGQKLNLYTPIADKYASPATLWLHSLQCKNTLCTALGRPTLSREDMLRIYRRDSEPKTTSTSTPRASTTTTPRGASTVTRSLRRRLGNRGGRP